MVVFVSLTALLAWPVGGAVDWRRALGGIDLLAAQVADPTWSRHAASVAGLWIAMWWSYFAVGWGLAGATPGKWVAGLRVIDHRGRAPIGVVRALLRLIAYAVSSLSIGAGHVMILLRADRLALHDVLAGTRVVRAKDLRAIPSPHSASDPDPDPAPHPDRTQQPDSAE